MGNCMSFGKGLAMGIVLGAAGILITEPLSDRQRHKLHKKTEGVFKGIGSMIDAAMDMLH